MFCLIYDFTLSRNLISCVAFAPAEASRTGAPETEPRSWASERASPVLQRTKYVGVGQMFLGVTSPYLYLSLEAGCSYWGVSLAAADAEHRRELKGEQNWGKNVSRRMSAWPLSDLNIFPEGHNLTEGSLYLRNKGRRTGGFFVKRRLPL